MGKTLDALLGRTFKSSKFKTLAKLAISRIAILKNHRQVRCSHARSDVIQLLNLGHQDRALLRVEHVIKEQNMLDVFVMIEGYCHLLKERVGVIKKNKECPDELKEATSSLLFAAPRCGEFPELQEIRKIFMLWFGKEFVDRAVESRNNCGVNPKMIQKLSARQSSLESRLRMLKEIALENRITLHLEGGMDRITEVGQQPLSPAPPPQGITLHLEGDTCRIDEKLDAKKQQLEPKKSTSFDDSEIGDDTYNLPEKINREEKFPESLRARKKYRDVVTAAQEAFESAAYAAAAARAAVELSRSESQDMDPNDHNDFNHHHQGIVSDSDGSLKSKLHFDDSTGSVEGKHSNNGLDLDMIYPIDDLSSESEAEETADDNKIGSKKSEESKKKEGTKRTQYACSSDLDGDILGERPQSHLGQNELLGKNRAFDGSNDEIEKRSTPRFPHDLGYDRKTGLSTNEFSQTRQFSAGADEDLSDENGHEIHYQSPKWIPLKYQGDSKVCSLEGKLRLESRNCLNPAKQLHSRQSNADKKPVSARTRKVHRG